MGAAVGPSVEVGVAAAEIVAGGERLGVSGRVRLGVWP